MDLLQALGASAETPPASDGWYTCVEVQAHTGKGDKAVRTMLAALKRQGRLEVGTVLRENLAGSIKPVPAYRLKEVVSS